MREKIAESIVQRGDKLYTLESIGDVVMWYILDHASYNDPCGRLPQYQVWQGDKRGYVGSDRKAAYKDFYRRCGK